MLDFKVRLLSQLFFLNAQAMMPKLKAQDPGKGKLCSLLSACGLMVPTQCKQSKRRVDDRCPDSRQITCWEALQLTCTSWCKQLVVSEKRLLTIIFSSSCTLALFSQVQSAYSPENKVQGKGQFWCELIPWLHNQKSKRKHECIPREQHVQCSWRCVKP